MPKDFEQASREALDAMRQWEENMERIGQEIGSIEFHDTFAPDFDKLEKIAQAQNQAPLDMVSELKAIHERLDVDRRERIESEKDAKKRDHKTFLVAALTLIATVIIGVITIWLQLSQ